MPKSSRLSRAGRRVGLNAAAIVVAMVEATSLHARTRPLDGVRLAESQTTAVSSDPYQAGRALLASGDVIAAITAFRAALVETPQSVDALNGLAVSYDRMGRYDISRAYYDSALAIDPDFAPLLNNLGYSLFLQGELRAAIPFLQKAAVSSDQGARAAGQRVLNLVAAQLRSDAARASTEAARTEAMAPSARVELSANGEQRLVFSRSKPDTEMTAKLGDAAPLIMIVAPWTKRDEQALVAGEAARDRAAAVAASVVPSADDVAAIVPRLMSLAVASDARRITDRLPAEVPVRRSLPRLAWRSPSVRPANDAGVVAARQFAIMPRPRSSSEGRQSGSAALHDNMAPAWLLASRRATATRSDYAAAGHAPQADTAGMAFDSDDHELNAFAARMRDIKAPEPAVAQLGTEQAATILRVLPGRRRAA